MRIIEIIDRSKQGVTLPFICRGADKEIYYIKGQGAGYRALCCEWVAGELARRCGLPIAPFFIVEIPAQLIKGSLRDDVQELGSGSAFGSRLVENAHELRWGDVTSGKIPEDLQAKIFIFDWWVGNNDRVLGEKGGNPNLLWSMSKAKLIMIDHNLAFSNSDDMPPTMLEFAKLHIFGSRFLNSNSSLLVKADEIDPLLSKARAELSRFWNKNKTALDEIWNELPETWTDSAHDFTLKGVRSRLDHIGSDSFLERQYSQTWR